MLFLFPALLAGMVVSAGFTAPALAADQQVATPLARVSTQSGLGFSIDRKPGEQVLSGSFLMLGISLPLSENLSAGVLTLADGGKSTRLDNYRLASLLSLTQRVGIIVDSLTFALGPYTETIEEHRSASSYRQRGTMAFLSLNKEIYATARFRLAVSSQLGLYRSSSSGSRGSGRGRTQGVCFSAAFTL